MDAAKAVSLALVAGKLAVDAAGAARAAGKLAGTGSYEVDPRRAAADPEDARALWLSALPGARELAEEVRQGGGPAARARLREFVGRAQSATQLTNCVTELLPAAERDAEALGELTAQERQRLPLLGVPVSIKECFEVVGTDSTGGVARYKGDPSTQDAVLVEALRLAGAVPFCKTNVSQLMLSWECSNPAYGTTSHPLHRHFIPGGSSGGEGCLIGQGGSILGLGTDVGGSVRIPAALCGCVGVKPTKNRLPGKGRLRTASTACFDGQQIVASVPGPLARTVDDALLFFESVLSPDVLARTSKLDCNQVPLPWDHEAALAERPLRIGFYESDDYVPVSPAVRRAVREAAQALRAAGHQLVPFQLPDLRHAWETFAGLMQSGQHWQLQELEGEALCDFMGKAARAAQLPRWLLGAVGKLAEGRAPHFAGSLAQIGAKTTTEYYKLVSDAVRYKAAFQKAMDDLELDLLLGPCQALPAQPRCSTKDFPNMVIYTALFNLIDFAAGTLPVTELRPDDAWPAGEHVADAVLDPPVREAYARALATGLPFPVVVQLVARPWREELLLRGLRELERATGGPFAARASKPAAPHSAL